MGDKRKDSGRAKLSNADVIEIRLLLQDGVLYNREIAERFNISEATVSRIKNGSRRAKS